ncbi:hypothetical protein M431DRAFT_102473 [Trichoderma harzianum CBS 226.95]|uniref:DUF300-domain-containing protein n=1 Tax=Trichoderma harzianum CBS 226.95 TaxID=983964 RepID=A0A2T3ZRB4_TRIHA|nr:hypothetical protein M431DRAFT_102473 [Trichoderma harzianum CBS 226.95]PTB47347.1 hypothetical protein M431DRAFT_102473 [Trichoderma harzianum CBS 226.95]
MKPLLSHLRAVSEVPIHGVLTFHHIALILVSFFVIISTSTSLYLMYQHATHYSVPHQQKYILRILFIIPAYGATCLLVTGFYRYYVYFSIIMAVLAPLILVGYLTFICCLIAPAWEQQQDWLRMKEARPWIFHLNLLYSITGMQNGPFRTPRTALTQFNIIWFCVYQYVVVSIMMGIVAISTQAVGKYCQTSLSTHFAHLWTTIFTALSMIPAMHTLIQAHWTIRHKFSHLRMDRKLLCIKLVIFLTSWQSIIFNLATAKVRSSRYIGQTDVQVVLQYLVLSVELIFFAFLHLKAYPWKDYVISFDQPGEYQGGAMGWRAFRDMANLSDIGVAIYRAAHWIFFLRGRRHLENRAAEKPNGVEDYNLINQKPVNVNVSDDLFCLTYIQWMSQKIRLCG